MTDFVNNSHVPLAGFTVPRPVFRRLQVLIPPAAQPLDLAVLKAHLRITHSNEDAYLQTLIDTATSLVETYLGRALISRTVKMWMDFVPGTGNDTALFGMGTATLPVRYGNIGMFRWFELMTVPVLSFTAFRYIPMNGGAEVTVDPSTYIADATDPDAPGRVILQRGAIWPTDLQVAHALSFEYVLGYGATAASVPAPLRHGVMLMAAALWSNRGDNADDLGASSVRSILDPYRIRRVCSL